MPLGIPYSVFSGRVVAPGKPQWTAQDRDMALSYLAHKAPECPNCRTRADEWKSDPDAYVVADYECEGCARLAAERDNLPDDPSEAERYMRGRHHYLKPRWLAELEAAQADQ